VAAQYPGGNAQREADIEAGAIRPARPDGHPRRAAPDTASPAPMGLTPGQLNGEGTHRNATKVP
jgi:hypothetical protein